MLFFRNVERIKAIELWNLLQQVAVVIESHADAEDAFKSVGDDGGVKFVDASQA